MVFGTEILGLWFATDGLYPDSIYTASWNIPLVVLSWFFAFAAAWCGLAISTLVSSESLRLNRYLWMLAGGFAMGGGVWAMHFLGMLAYDLPFEITYDIGLTLLSWLIAVASMILAVRVFSLQHISVPVMAGASLALAGGIGGMHYVGMAGMAGQFSMLYDPAFFALSLIIALVLAFVAYGTRAAMTRKQHQADGSGWQPLTAVVIATTITAMHYVAMSAVVFYPGTLCAATGPVLEADVIAVLLMAFVFLLIGLITIAGITRNAMIQSHILQAILDHSIDAFLVIDGRGLIRSANPAIEIISGWKVEELVGFHMSVLLPHDIQDQHVTYMKEVNQDKRDNFMGRKRVIYLRNRLSERVPVHVGVTRLPQAGNMKLYAAQIHRASPENQDAS